MKVLFINNYPMERAWGLWENGEYPGHHLWGITHLHKYGIDVDILPYEKYVILNKMGHYFRLGDYLDQQLRTLLKWYQYDLIYSGCQVNTFLLSLVRYLGILRIPVVALIHHPIRKSRLRSRVFFEGHDKMLCLSHKVMKQLEDGGVSKEKLGLLEWGVDLPFYDKGNDTLNKSEFIVSAGKTGRDHDTLAKAFIEINYPLTIYCSAETAPTIPELTSNIKVQFNHPKHNAISYKELLAEYKRAYAIAVPLKDTDNLAGLTSLLDAMAMGKAVVMTRNSQIDIDIEKEGIGIWVKAGDVAGWQQAISYLLHHPQETQEMGNRGYYLCKSKYNLETFSSSLAKMLKSILQKSP